MELAIKDILTANEKGTDAYVIINIRSSKEFSSEEDTPIPIPVKNIIIPDSKKLYDIVV